jgi:hypothetical protein
MEGRAGTETAVPVTPFMCPLGMSRRMTPGDKKNVILEPWASIAMHGLARYSQEFKEVDVIVRELAEVPLDYICGPSYSHGPIRRVHRRSGQRLVAYFMFAAGIPGQDVLPKVIRFARYPA